MINKKIITGLVFILFIGNLISALAISSAYWSENPLKVVVGESKDIKLIVQNMAGEVDISVKAEIISGSEIIQLIDSEDIYFLPFKTKKEVNFKVTIPEDAKIGQEYNVKVGFTTVTTTESGTTGIGSSVVKGFPILATGKDGELEAKKPEWLIYLIVGIIVLIVIYSMIKKKKRGRK